MDRKSWPIRLMAVLLVVPAFACADRDEAEVEIDTETEAPPPAAAAPVTVQLMPLGGSTLTGEAVATHNPEDVNVRVTLSGLTEGGDNEAKLKYGMCTDAQAHLEGDDAAGTTGGTATTPGTQPAAGQMVEHEPGDEFADIDLNMTGTTATGSADVDTEDLRENEPAYLAVTTGGVGDEKTVVACADLTGHNMGPGMGSGTPSTTTPDATTPETPETPAR